MLGSGKPPWVKVRKIRKGNPQEVGGEGDKTRDDQGQLPGGIRTQGIGPEVSEAWGLGVKPGQRALVGKVLQSSSGETEVEVRGSLRVLREGGDDPEIMWLVDTGATRSIVSIETYRRYLGHCPLEKVRAPMTAINGSSIEVLGKCRLTIGLNGRDYTHQFLVACIKDVGVLGRDFLRTHRCYWNWEANTLEIDGQEIKCRVPVIAEEPTIEVKAVRSYVIPARTEMVIEGTIAGHERPLTTGMI